MVRQHKPDSLKPVNKKKEVSGWKKQKVKELENRKVVKLRATAASFFKSQPQGSGSASKLIPPIEDGTMESLGANGENNETDEKEQIEADMGESSSSVVLPSPSPVPLDLLSPTLQAMTTEFSEELNGTEITIDCSDPSTWIFPITNQIRQKIVSLGPTQKVWSNYPAVTQGNSFDAKFYYGIRKNGESYHRNWLQWSESTNTFFCFACGLFGSDSTTSSFKNFGFGRVGFNDYRNRSRSIKEHENSQLHFTSIINWKKYVSNVSNSFSKKNSVAMLKAETYWCDVLKGLLDIILFLAKHNLSFQGSSSNLEARNCGNFLGLVNLLSKYYNPLAKHKQRLTSERKRQVTYLSHDIQNEFISICAETVKAAILEKVSKNKYFAVAFDSTPDISRVDHVSQVIRTVSCSTDGCKVDEHFINFISTQEKTGHGMSEVILDKVGNDGLDMRNCRGQSYDNGANMAAAYKGVQARISEMYPFAQFVACAAHSLNLVGANAAEKVPKASLSLGKIQNIYLFFSKSTSRWTFLKEISQITLKGNSTTRWSARSDAVSALRLEFASVLETLVKITTIESKRFTPETVADANARLTDITSFEFYFPLVIWDKILYKIQICNLTLQNKDTDVYSGKNILEGLLRWLKRFRLEGFQECKSIALSEATKFGIDEFSGNEKIRVYRGQMRKRLEEKAEDVQMTHMKAFEATFFNALVVF